MKKYLFFCSTVLLLIFCLVLIETYGVFETNTSGSSNLSIGNWEILVNDVDVTIEEEISLSDFIYQNGQHTQSGYFAPGSTAYMDVTIDASAADVAVAYVLTIDDSELDNYPNINLVVTNLDTNQTISGDIVQGQILLNNASRTASLRFTVQWTNNSLYDDSDTELIDEDLSFSVSANFSQLLSSS